ncbi:MAG: GDSL-type esterase/lipase family protein [Clostridiales bacterium]|jgi:lysophospholipase L1-like esterase/Na+-transporting methylmalonyl-CoA/oxaloacetate decarboxylase gamma subunit|nr:GDSL-type esterase/lipase family protein [Clostridiales bacterium]
MKNRGISQFILLVLLIFTVSCASASAAETVPEETKAKTDKIAEILSSGKAENNESEKETDNEEKEGEVMATEITTQKFYASGENVKPIGRAYFSENILWCAHSGTGAEFSFKGTSAKITVQGDSASARLNEGNHARIAIYLNGERVIDDLLKEPSKTYTVFETEAERDAVITVVKLSESAMSTFGIKEIEVTAKGSISPTPEKEMLIEFIGDSITCGYGIDDEDREHHFSTSTEDFTKTYAYKTAQELNADYSAVALSGYGIISGYTTGAKASTQTLPKYYDNVGFSYGTFPGFDAAQTSWGFTRKADVIVINLGTNDDSYCQNDADKQAEFTAKYEEFIKTVREHNKDAKILCTLGIMGGRLYPSVELAAENYIKATGDENVFCMKFDEQQMSDGLAADWHPTERTNVKAAKKLTDEIKKITAQ